MTEVLVRLIPIVLAIDAWAGFMYVCGRPGARVVKLSPFVLAARRMGAVMTGIAGAFAAMAPAVREVHRQMVAFQERIARAEAEAAIADRRAVGQEWRS